MGSFCGFILHINIFVCFVLALLYPTIAPFLFVAEFFFWVSLLLNLFVLIIGLGVLSSGVKDDEPIRKLAILFGNRSSLRVATGYFSQVVLLGLASANGLVWQSVLFLVVFGLRIAAMFLVVDIYNKNYGAKNETKAAR